MPPKRPHTGEQAEITGKVDLSVETIDNNKRGLVLVPLPVSDTGYNANDCQIAVFDDKIGISENANPAEPVNAQVLACANGMGGEIARLGLDDATALKLFSMQLRPEGVIKGGLSYQDAKNGLNVMATQKQIVLPLTTKTDARAGQKARVTLNDDYKNPSTTSGIVPFVLEADDGTTFVEALLAARRLRNTNPNADLTASPFRNFVLNSEVHELMCGILFLKEFLDAGLVIVNPNTPLVSLQSPLSGGATAHTPEQTINFTDRIGTGLGLVRWFEGTFTPNQMANLKAVDPVLKLIKSKFLAATSLSRDDELAYYGNIPNKPNPGVDSVSRTSEENTTGKMIDQQLNSYSRLIGAFWGAHNLYDGNVLGRFLTPAKGGNAAYVSVSTK